jgi:predicted AAA+ superfamily ATPase
MLGGNYIPRHIEKAMLIALQHLPVTALIGPRQCGKSTLAKKIIHNLTNVVYLDLERPSDLLKLDNAEWFFASQHENLFCIDEIQRKPELFPVIRSFVDEWGGNGKFLILGSASRDLLKQSSESLAGRITYKQLTPFLWSEISEQVSLKSYIERGGFPRSILSPDDSISFTWREDFISTFLERDLLQWKGFSRVTMQRLWQMLAHVNGQTVNHSLLGSSLGVSNVTIRNYIDLLAGTFMVEVIPPYYSNRGKRMVKSSRVYISDSGITSALLHLRGFNELAGHPAIGAVWEQIILTNLKGHFPGAEFFFYRTTAGAEIDLVMRYDHKIFAIECKSSLSPQLTKGFYNGIEDINPDYSFVASPVSKGWEVSESLKVVSISELIDSIQGENLTI